MLALLMALACRGDDPTRTRFTMSLIQPGLLADLTPVSPICQLPDNHWNVRVDGAPLDGASASIITGIRAMTTTNPGRLHPDCGGGYGIPYAVVSMSQPKIIVPFSEATESDAGAPGEAPGYPIPTGANIPNPNPYIEALGSSEGERHMLILREDMMLFEMSYVTRTGDMEFSAGYGAVFNLNTNDRRPLGYTSTDAAGLEVLPGLMRYDEVYGLDPIRHALRFSIRKVNGYVEPARHTGSYDVGGYPCGMRMRLQASFDVEAYLTSKGLTGTHRAAMKKILVCLKEYGCIVADRGGNMYFQGTLDTRWNNAILNPFFHGLNANNFEVVKRGWVPTTPIGTRKVNFTEQ